MRYTLISLRNVAILGLLLALATTLSVRAQQQAPPTRTAEQQFKNIQVLKGIPAAQVIPVMHLIVADLGVECAFCHVEVNGEVAGYFEKDDKATKQTARKMITMMAEINKNSFGSEQVVTCYTCHHGSHVPVDTPMLPVPKPAPTGEVTAAPALPAPNQILNKYIQALGGEPAIRKVSSRMITATQEVPTGPGGSIPVPSQVEQYAKSPNLVLKVYHTDKFTISDGFDGNLSWAQGANGVVNEAPPPDQGRAKRGADFYESLNLQKEYARLEVRGVEKLGGRDAYLVVGFPANDTPEQLYFDRQTGLLLRKAGVLPTAGGDVPFQIDYDDYRDTGSGVKIPFVVRMVPASPRLELFTSATFRVQTVKDNAPVDNAKFAKPQSKPATSNTASLRP